MGSLDGQRTDDDGQMTFRQGTNFPHSIFGSPVMLLMQRHDAFRPGRNTFNKSNETIFAITKHLFTVVTIWIKVL
ncbi:hypothetical protein [Pseudoduganella umbonata]|uniref:Uncharacterized protein n=1 Tax=Pseudoduganella umbonata TaxID=864828 RepID=A0A4P8HL05_9BURK|nr:hypothetical protein [Pseudoduganella umbonata]MBB3219508.1 hypothetical protein [Pseudoduganella umbonata]QCP09586.1 hypothetical protein FCL38_03490 [Pseudoduganella umbonata]